MNSSPDLEENTSAASPSSKLRTVPPIDGDLHELIGQVMASQARLERKIADFATLPSEVAALRRDIELDRGDLVHGASTSAASKSSNRLALLMGALFSLYEVSSPVVAQIWKALHQ